MKDPRLILPDERKPFPPYVYHRPLLTPEECARIRAYAAAQFLRPGTVGNAVNGEFRTDETYRKVATCQIPVGGEFDAMYAKIAERVRASNEAHFGFDIHGLWQGLEYLRYDFTSMGPVGHYDWHQDFGGGVASLRKISLSIQLSSPSEYDGCRLQLFTDRTVDPGCVELGDGVMFPSWLPHCVTPITRGTREALVAWVAGPRFR